MLPVKDNIPHARLPVVTLALIAVNVVAYLLEIRRGGSFFGGPARSVDVHYGAIPYELTHPGKHCELIAAHAPAVEESIVCQPAPFAVGHPGVSATPAPQPATWVTVFTAMFLHGSFLQLFCNMLFLAIFGPTVEDALGRVRYAAFYLAGGLVALAAQVAVSPSSPSPALGASGAVAAVLGGYILLYPRARVLTLVFIVFLVTIVEVPAAGPAGRLARRAAAVGTRPASPCRPGSRPARASPTSPVIGGLAFGLLSIRLLARHRAPPSCRERLA